MLLEENKRCVRDASCRIGIVFAKQTISRFNGLNFDCVISNNALNCINNFFDPYLPIHHTTFMALRFVLRPFAVRIRTVKRSSVEIFQSHENLDRFSFCPAQSA